MTVVEDIVLDLILTGGFERPDVNEPLVIEGRRVVPDFRWPKQRRIVEADGSQWHDHKLAREDDAERQAFLESHGEHVIRDVGASRHQALTNSTAPGGCGCSLQRPSSYPSSVKEVDAGCGWFRVTAARYPRRCND